MSSDEESTDWDAPEPMQTSPPTTTTNNAGPFSLHPESIYPHHEIYTETSSSSSLNYVHVPREKRPAPQEDEDDDEDIDQEMSGHKKMTAKMKDRQARGKEWEISTTEEDESDTEFRRHYADPTKHIPTSNQTYTALQRRRTASLILDSPEILMMYASARSDSIPATRLHFTKILCGYEEAENAYPFEKSCERDGHERGKKKGRKGRGEKGARFRPFAPSEVTED